ncbi:MAG: MltA domain-containing protein [Alphaproteobacteria bacterium]|nr:MltA domain-containing protein [Alphaproteobacteria bacterium]
MRSLVVAGIVAAVLLAGCSERHRLSRGRAFHLEKVSYARLPGWREDKVLEAAPALAQSCRKPTAAMKGFCDGLPGHGQTPDRLRAHIEKHLTPYRVVSNGADTGVITGYYEAELTGTRTKRDDTQRPIYGMPANKRHTGLRRAEIERHGSFDAPVIAWADDPVDLFILHVQGSGRVKTPDGEIRLGYAGNNGHTFKALSRIMDEEGVPKSVRRSMTEMRAWLRQNPDRVRELLAKNPRYIYFRKIAGQTPVGASGAVLTPLRSVAVDDAYIPMHTPMFLDTRDPDGYPLKRLVVAQDVGSAIKGPIRADFFWGHGDMSFHKAGRMKSAGSYYLLLPKE